MIIALVRQGRSQSVTEQQDSKRTTPKAQLVLTKEKLTLTLPLNHRVEKPARARVQLELMYPHDTVSTNEVNDVTLLPGQRQLSVELADQFRGVPAADLRKLRWLRVRYAVRSEDGEVLAAGVEGLSASSFEPFSLTALAAKEVLSGAEYQPRVHVASAAGAAQSGVEVRGELSWNGTAGEEKLTALATTDVDGNALLSLPIPTSVGYGSGNLKISAQPGLVARSLESELWFTSSQYMRLDTDKDIYQPGQTLHLRALLFDARRKAQAGQDLDARITDEESTAVMHQHVTTDSFGVAHLDWPIPANVRQGSYEIRLALKGRDLDRQAIGVTSARIYRYDLPNFTVTATPDRAYYLPGQDAEVTITAEYLFGESLKRGKVRVVQEENRDWNFRQQKWEVKESQEQSGELDGTAHFKAHFTLEKYFADLKYDPYCDLYLAAYVTDLTTGRTEQRRFVVRVTQEPIHVYMLPFGGGNPKLPASYFVSTFYADGTPARCTVRLRALDKADKHGKKRLLRTAETNQYGLAKITEVKLTEREKDGSLLVEARDNQGRAGRALEHLYRYGDDDTIEVTTLHAIHKPGDPIAVWLGHPNPNLRALVEVLHDGEVLASRQVTLSHGKAYLEFSWEPRFGDEMEIVAYSLEGAGNGFGRSVVLYPKNRRLNVKVDLDRVEHRPGEGAAASVSVQLPGRLAVQSMLGVKITDRAVEERVNTDSDFGSRFRGHWWHWSLWSSNPFFGFSGITRGDLDLVDLSRPIPEDFDLVAEYILEWSAVCCRRGQVSAEPDPTARETFKDLVAKQFAPLEEGLRKWNMVGRPPRNRKALAALGKECGVNIDDLRDPWGTSYRYDFDFGSNLTLTARSAGPDKQFGTEDDFEARQTHWSYFWHYGTILDAASNELADAEGRFIRDRKTLQSEMLKRGVDFDALRDPWGKPYETRFYVVGVNFVVQVISRGGDKGRPRSEGTTVWHSLVDYLRKPREHIAQILRDRLQKGGAFPSNETEFKAILREGGVDLDQLRDPWGSPYYVVFKSEAQYGDRVAIRQSDAAKRESEPVTLWRKRVTLMSAGADEKPGTDDDFPAASYSVLVSEQSAKEQQPRPVPPGMILRGDAGAITGTVIASLGAVIAGAKVEATRDGTGESYSAQTDSNGNFALKDLDPGTYQIEASAEGFLKKKMIGVPVLSMQLTEVSIELAVGGATETVEVEADVLNMQYESTQQANAINEVQVGVLPNITHAITQQVYTLPGVRNDAAPRTQQPGVRVPRASVIATLRAMSTPRLRQDFPETMLWEPALVTDSAGRAHLNFKLADNITTWKLTAVASTKDGELGGAESDLRVFQPFFVEHDPPRILTQGDEIDYAVVLRNYLDHSQTLKTWINPEPWFTLLGPAELGVNVDPGDAARAVFRYRTVAAVTNGTQQVSAANEDISDAARKPVDVHPFGRLASMTAGDLIARKGNLALVVPHDALAGPVRARVKVYPNLLAHIVENLEAGLEKPHGCAEQTISAAYPSLLVAELYAHADEKPSVALKAHRYLAAGYEDLLRFQEPAGGFSYWGHGEAPDLALTAYALEFLHHAANLFEVDAAVMQRAEQWILEQQRPDGSWRRLSDANDQEALLLTAYVAGTLAQVTDKEMKAQDARRAALGKALVFLAAHRDLLNEPYVVASYALAARAAGDEREAADLIALLRKSAHYEGSVAYWSLERNTPFYGWGRTGRLESTALALRALNTGTTSIGSDQLIRKGLLFLLRNENKDGMWYTGQTTVHVLKTLLSMVGARGGKADGLLRVRVNGKESQAIDLRSGTTVEPPLEFDVTDLVRTGDNLVELETSNPDVISAQFVVDTYLPWLDVPSVVSQSEPNANSTLQFEVAYSKTQATVGDRIACRVRAERLGYRGYGMMLAEVGLPPGADVDRQSLETALKGNYSLYQYDVLPDRVILYIWPRAGGSEFSFQFRPRFAMHAQTAPSQLYDYYNPEASVTIKPARFEVMQGKE